MVAFFSILLAVVLLGITVYGLHRYQTMEVEYTVDRSMPLPPLEPGKESEQESENKSEGGSEEGSEEASQPAPQPKAPDHTPLGQQPAPAQPPPDQPNKQKPDTRTSDTQTWLQIVADLKKADRLDEAMTVCRQEFPLWGAYNQACIIERLKLKQAGNGAANEQTFLNRLYRLAATAELLHDKSEHTESLPLSQLRKLDLTRLEQFEFPYKDLGYAHLRLVRKSDIKLMLVHWGRPPQHQLPRQLYSDWWQQVQKTPSKSWQ